jgi:ribosomal protein S18 acetylase RimI-like enzyme
LKATLKLQVERHNTNAQAFYKQMGFQARDRIPMSKDPLALLRPEIVMLTLSLVAIVLERRRREQGGRVRYGAALQPSVSR